MKKVNLKSLKKFFRLIVCIFFVSLTGCSYDDGIAIGDGNPNNTAPTAIDVSISGTTEVGSTLTGFYTYSDADSDSEGTSSFEWLSYDDAACTTDETVIGISRTYTLTTSENGRWIKYEVTPVADSGVSSGAAVTSSAVGPITTNTAPTASSVSISGTTEVGSILTGSYTYHDTDSDSEGTSVFKWLSYTDAGCTTGEIVIGTGQTYTTTASEDGKWIKFEVTPVANSGETPGVVAASSAVGAITTNTVPTASSVFISGRADAGADLIGNYTYSDADFDPEGTSTFRWLSYTDAFCTTDETVIGTGQTYTLTASEYSKWIKFEVTPEAGSGTSPGSAVASSEVGPVSSIPYDYVARWKLDNNGIEETGFYDATVDNGTPIYSTIDSDGNPPKEGTHLLDLDGNDSLSTSNYVPTDSKISMSAWIYLDSTFAETYSQVIDLDHAGIYYHSSGYIRGGPTGSSYVESEIDPDTWYHVVFTYDKSLALDNVKLYINGDSTPIDTYDNDDIDLTDIDAPFIIGRYSGGSDFWVGDIDDIIFYNRVLTGAEVNNIYTNYE